MLYTITVSHRALFFIFKFYSETKSGDIFATKELSLSCILIRILLFSRQLKNSNHLLIFQTASSASSVNAPHCRAAVSPVTTRHCWAVLFHQLQYDTAGLFYFTSCSTTLPCCSVSSVTSRHCRAVLFHQLKHENRVKHSFILDK